MWVARLKLRYDLSVMGKRCERYRVSSLGMSLSHYSSGENTSISYYETFTGEDQPLVLLSEDLKNDPTLKDIEIGSGVAFFRQELSNQQPHPRKMVPAGIFFLSPIKTDKEGLEHWELGCSSEQKLRDFVVLLQKEHLEIKVVSIASQPLQQEYGQVMPGLTDAQQEAVSLAAKRGYYNYPRKVDLQMLSGEAGKSLSTFREHLRKGEKKLFEEMFGKPEQILK
ncbi:MAG: helix-turn-helix domain-containing protein [Nanoarchaeota archaeon]|nr:helix-turn-helix domain-containing protein [Nanoarchaeota archaeon]